ncbi:hypothetical protein J6590_019380 [Homalodisca vitripennis]|nr:hypothetical protein J6590_019380 [Homalodisca vitripennis]
MFAARPEITLESQLRDYRDPAIKLSPGRRRAAPRYSLSSSWRNDPRMCFGQHHRALHGLSARPIPVNIKSEESTFELTVCLLQDHPVNTMEYASTRPAHSPATARKDSQVRAARPTSTSVRATPVRTMAPVWTIRGLFAVSACQVGTVVNCEHLYPPKRNSDTGDSRRGDVATAVQTTLEADRRVMFLYSYSAVRASGEEAVFVGSGPVLTLLARPTAN